MYVSKIRAEGIFAIWLIFVILFQIVFRFQVVFSFVQISFGLYFPPEWLKDVHIYLFDDIIMFCFDYLASVYFVVFHIMFTTSVP